MRGPRPMADPRELLVSRAKAFSVPGFSSSRAVSTTSPLLPFSPSPYRGNSSAPLALSLGVADGAAHAKKGEMCMCDVVMSFAIG